jgi:hypothetical protein
MFVMQNGVASPLRPVCDPIVGATQTTRMFIMQNGVASPSGVRQPGEDALVK